VGITDQERRQIHQLHSAQTLSIDLASPQHRGGEGFGGRPPLGGVVGKRAIAQVRLLEEDPRSQPADHQQLGVRDLAAVETHRVELSEVDRAVLDGDDEGFLKITDRKKDLIVTAGGKNVAPQRIERIMRTSHYIAQVVAFGDKRKFISALITLEPDNIQAWAVEHGLGTKSVSELAALIAAAQPEVVYTHNLADKHDTHVAVALRTIEALRRVPPALQPAAVYGCEVWRDLDWMCDEDKVVFDVTDRENVAAALMGVYDSQVSGGKRYDLATAGRRLAHATFSASHAVDTAEALIYAMDLTPLIADPALDPKELVTAHIARMEQEITNRLGRLSEETT